MEIGANAILLISSGINCLVELVCGRGANAQRAQREGGDPGPYLKIQLLEGIVESQIIGIATVDRMTRTLTVGSVPAHFGGTCNLGGTAPILRASCSAVHSWRAIADAFSRTYFVWGNYCRLHVVGLDRLGDRVVLVYGCLCQDRVCMCTHRRTC